ncbi:MAG: DUF2309 domain-containing protein [Nitrospiria bacterium]
MEQVEKAPYSETRRMQLRSLILLSSEIISPYWPLRTFVHHNPLHNLENLRFEDAVKRGNQILKGKGYLSNDLYRDYVRSGRIRLDQIDGVLKTLVEDKHVSLGDRSISQLEVLRAHLLNGLTAPSQAILDAQISRRADRDLIKTLANHLVLATGSKPIFKNPRISVPGERISLGLESTLAEWCDFELGSQIMNQINSELIKWCEAFLDEGHATWSMPDREKGFYGAWKFLAKQEWSPCGIAENRSKIAKLPESPEDALLEHLADLGIPPQIWQDYLTLHLAALPGWVGFIKWRTDQTDYEWQQAYPIDLVQYLAVRVWYERELVKKVFREEFNVDGNFGVISAEIQKRGIPKDPPSLDSLRNNAAWSLLDLASALNIIPDALISTSPDTLAIVLKWLDDLPETEHGMIWLKILEIGYQEQLINKLMSNISKIHEESKEGTDDQKEVRPQAQTVFCIDVRSEPFRRQLENIGDYDTYGFAGFFTVAIRFRALGSHHDTDQFPVILTAKNTVKEVARTFQGQMLNRHRAGIKLLSAGHELLHDLKENMVTPYVTVETLGWFYGIPLVGKTFFADSYRRLITRLRRLFVPTIATSLTVEKLSKKEVYEMMAAEQRAVIRRALHEHFGDRKLNLSLDRLESLRLRALDEPVAVEQTTRRPSQSYALTPDEESDFIEDLRLHYQINHGWAFARMERITQMGFTLSEQVFTAEAALRMIGLTRNFARLVLFCGHSSMSENNPFESALDCGACGGNSGKPNARVLAAMCNKPQLREHLAKNGIIIPLDTYFIAGQHNTTTDEVELYDLEDLPSTHFNDLARLRQDLIEASIQNSRERCTRFPEFNPPLKLSKAVREVRRRSGDWSQVRPEWGLSGNAAFIIGRREITKGINLEGRVFLQSYDYRQDPTGRSLEILMTAPQVVGQWINMEHYFSTVDNNVYGSGSKIYHNIVGRFGIMSGPQSDLRTGLASQTVLSGARPYHEPLRMLTLIEATRERVSQIIPRHQLLSRYYDNGWVRLAIFEPIEKIFYLYIPKQKWEPIENGALIS